MQNNDSICLDGIYNKRIFTQVHLKAINLITIIIAVIIGSNLIQSLTIIVIILINHA